MDELIYGVWKGRAYDNRRCIDGKAPEGLPVSEFLAFNSGNPVAGFAGPQGFLMFDNRVTCLLYTSLIPRDRRRSRMPSSA